MIYISMNILLSVDNELVEYMKPLLNSIMINTKSQEKIFFYILVDLKSTCDILCKIFDNLSVKVINKPIIKIFGDIEKKIIDDNVRITTAKHERLKNHMNFARFWLPIYFFEVKYGLYLDADMIVNHDILELQTLCNFNEYNIWCVRNESTRPHQIFNAGMYYLNLEFWRENNLTENCLEIMKKHKKSKNGLFGLGTQPIINILFENKWGELSSEWNVLGLGHKVVDIDILTSGKILHWNGPLKPWSENGRYKEYYERYN